MADSMYGTGLDQLARSFLDTTAQERLVAAFVFYNFGRKRKIPKNSGNSYQWARFDNLQGSAATGGISESAVATTGQVQLSANTTSLTMYQYGQYISITSLGMQTAPLDIYVAATEALSDSASDCVDLLERACLSTALTTQTATPATGDNRRFVNGLSTATITAEDVLSVTELKLLYRNLQLNKVKPLANGLYVYVANPMTTYNLLTEQGVYSMGATFAPTNPTSLIKNGGQSFALGGFQIVNTSQVGTFSGAAVTSYQNYAIGDGAYTSVSLEDSPIKIVVHEPGTVGSDPYDNICTIAWHLKQFGVTYTGADGPRAIAHVCASS